MIPRTAKTGWMPLGTAHAMVHLLAVYEGLAWVAVVTLTDGLACHRVVTVDLESGRISNEILLEERRIADIPSASMCAVGLAYEYDYVVSILGVDNIIWQTRNSHLLAAGGSVVVVARVDLQEIRILDAKTGRDRWCRGFRGSESEQAAVVTSGVVTLIIDGGLVQVSLDEFQESESQLTPYLLFTMGDRVGFGTLNGDGSTVLDCAGRRWVIEERVSKVSGSESDWISVGETDDSCTRVRSGTLENEGMIVRTLPCDRKAVRCFSLETGHVAFWPDGLLVFAATGVEAFRLPRPGYATAVSWSGMILVANAERLFPVTGRSIPIAHVERFLDWRDKTAAIIQVGSAEILLSDPEGGMHVVQADLVPGARIGLEVPLDSVVRGILGPHILLGAPHAAMVLTLWPDE